jgi:hypothetical protein
MLEIPNKPNQEENRMSKKIKSYEAFEIGGPAVVSAAPGKKEQIIGYAKIPMMEMGKNGVLVSRVGSFPVFARLEGFDFPGKKLNRAKTAINKNDCPFGTCVNPIERKRPASRRSCATCKQRSSTHESLRRRRSGNSISRCAGNSLSQSESPASQRKNSRISDNKV